MGPRLEPRRQRPRLGWGKELIVTAALFRYPLFDRIENPTYTCGSTLM